MFEASGRKKQDEEGKNQYFKLLCIYYEVRRRR